MPKVDTLEELISQSITCDNRLFKLRQERRSGWRNDGTFAAFSKSPENHSTGPESMQIDAVRVKSLTPEERKRRMDEGLCLYCGDQGHRAGSCPKKQNRRIVKTRGREYDYAGNRRCPATIGTVRLDNSIPQQKSGSTLSAQPANCFTIPLSFGPQKIKILALLDSGASACFLDKEFAERHKIPLVLKSKPVHIEVIDGRPLLSGSVTHESKPIEVAFENHSSFVIFNIIRTPSNPVVFGLS